MAEIAQNVKGGFSIDVPDMAAPQIGGTANLIAAEQIKPKWGEDVKFLGMNALAAYKGYQEANVEEVIDDVTGQLKEQEELQKDITFTQRMIEEGQASISPEGTIFFNDPTDPGIKDMQGRIDKFLKAEKQGVMTRSEALARIDQAVKQASAALPGYASDFRRTAAERTAKAFGSLEEYNLLFNETAAEIAGEAQAKALARLHEGNAKDALEAGIIMNPAEYYVPKNQVRIQQALTEIRKQKTIEAMLNTKSGIDKLEGDQLDKAITADVAGKLSNVTRSFFAGQIMVDETGKPTDNPALSFPQIVRELSDPSRLSPEKQAELLAHGKQYLTEAQNIMLARIDELEARSSGKASRENMTYLRTMVKDQLNPERIENIKQFTSIARTLEATKLDTALMVDRVIKNNKAFAVLNELKFPVGPMYIKWMELPDDLRRQMPSQAQDILKSVDDLFTSTSGQVVLKSYQEGKLSPEDIGLDKVTALNSLLYDGMKDNAKQYLINPSADLRGQVIEAFRLYSKTGFDPNDANAMKMFNSLVSSPGFGKMWADMNDNEKQLLFSAAAPKIGSVIHALSFRYQENPTPETKQLLENNLKFLTNFKGAFGEDEDYYRELGAKILAGEKVVIRRTTLSPEEEKLFNEAIAKGAKTNKEINEYIEKQMSARRKKEQQEKNKLGLPPIPGMEKGITPY